MLGGIGNPTSLLDGGGVSIGACDVKNVDVSKDRIGRLSIGDLIGSVV
jgi:hypothetical protein